MDREDFITVETKSLWTVDLRINVVPVNREKKSFPPSRKIAVFNLPLPAQSVIYEITLNVNS